MKIHVVRDGDTLVELAQKYNVPIERLLESNPTMENKEGLKIGNKVRIPTGKISLHKQEETKEMAKDDTPEKAEMKKSDSPTVEEGKQYTQSKNQAHTENQEEIAAPYFPEFQGAPVPMANYNQYNYPWPYFSQNYPNVSNTPYDMNFLQQPYHPMYYNNVTQSQNQFVPPNYQFVPQAMAHVSCCQPPVYGTPVPYNYNYNYSPEESNSTR